MKKCKSGYYYCNTDKKCKPIPKGYRIGYGGYLRHDKDDDDSNGKKKNGNGHGGNGNGNGGNGNGNGGNGGGGNGGGMSEGSLHKWFKGSKSKDGKGGWVNVVTGGTCASDEPGEGTPKCVSSAKRASMTKAERLSAARRKKKADPGQQSKSGAAKPTYVSTDSPRKKKMKESHSNWRNEIDEGIRLKTKDEFVDGIKSIPGNLNKFKNKIFPDRASSNEPSVTAGTRTPKSTHMFKHVPSMNKDGTTGQYGKKGITTVKQGAEKSINFVKDKAGDFAKNQGMKVVKNVAGPVAAGLAVSKGVDSLMKMGKKKQQTEEVVSEKVGGVGTLVRQGVKVGGKTGGRVVQKGTTAATQAGKAQVAKAQQGNESKMVGSGKFEKAGAFVGGALGGAAGVAIPDGPAMVAGELAGGYAGSKIGGKIGRQIDKIGAKKKMKEEVVTEADKKGKGSGSKDACYHKVKSRYSVWPSAYASGALVKCRKVGAANWGNSSKKEEFEPTGISFQQFSEKCWKGYEKKGMKTMFGKRYPNCVKKEQVERDEYGDPMGGPKISKKEVKKNLAKNEPDKQHTTDTSEGMAYGITRGSGKPSGQMAAFGKEKKKENPYSLKNKLKMVIKSVAEKERAKAGVTKEGYKGTMDMSKSHPEAKKKVEDNIEKHFGTKKVPGGKMGVKEEVISERQKTNQGERQSQEAGRSNYGKATIRNKRKFGTSGELPDPLTGKKITKDATRGELISKRREEHKAKRGVKEEVGVSTSTMMDKAKKEAMLRKKEQDAVAKKMKKEETVTLQDADGNDFVQIVDVISSKKVMSDWRNELSEDDMKGMSVKSGHKRPTKSGAGMTQKGVEAYRRRNPGSKLKTAVTTEPSKLKKGSKDANRRKSYCARSAGQMKKFPKAAKDPDSRLRQARRRWNC